MFRVFGDPKATFKFKFKFKFIEKRKNNTGIEWPEGSSSR